MSIIITIMMIALMNIFAAFCSDKCDVPHTNAAMGCQQCKIGFKEPGCCECEDRFRKTPSGQCCQENNIEINGACTREY